MPTVDGPRDLAMMTPVDAAPENPYLVGVHAPVTTEIDADDLEVIGEIPRDLNGVYLRNGPNRRFPAGGRYHWFDGDGMVHAMAFENGPPATATAGSGPRRCAPRGPPGTRSGPG